jgi:hypothetical protein
MKTRLLHLMLLGAMTIPIVHGQIDAGRIAGTITDATGAVIPAATVTVKNENTGRIHKAVANEKGVYLVSQLSPSRYTVTAEAAGMAPAEYTGIGLQVGQERTLNVTLQPSTVNTEVVVSGGALTVIDTSSAAIGGNVSAREVAELPINGRQISQLYMMAPGAVNFGPGTFDDVRFNGRSFEQNALRFDGIEAGGIVTNNPSNIGGEINSVFRLQASMENVQEFRVDASNYPAEFGTGSGGQISIVTKSGGNALHGGVFEYFRNDALDARNEFDGASPSVLRLNQFGGSVGGPVVKDKTFFFAGVEAMAQRNRRAVRRKHSQPRGSLGSRLRARRDSFGYRRDLYQSGNPAAHCGFSARRRVDIKSLLRPRQRSRARHNRRVFGQFPARSPDHRQRQDLPAL